MNTYYNNATHSMYLNFSLDENGNDRVRIGSAPRTDSGAYDTKNGVAVTLYKNSYKTTKDGNPNYRNAEVFYKAIDDLMNQYKKDPDNMAIKQFSCSYMNAVTNHTMQFAFGIVEKDGIPSYILYLQDSFEGKSKKSIYRFKDADEVDKFTEQIKVFCDEYCHTTSHLIQSEMQKIISKAVGEQLCNVVREEITNLYPELSKVVISAVNQALEKR